jgi:hypothetical protein
MKENKTSDLCTLEVVCGHLGKNKACLNKDRCTYKLSEKYLSLLKESTIEYILRIEGKLNRKLSKAEIILITPLAEIEGNLIIDSKGNIMNLNSLKVIRRVYKK